MTIKTISSELKKEYGQKIYRLSLTSGCTCPNRDGAISYGGCTFCSEGGSGDFAAPLLPIEEQIRLAKEKVDSKIPASIPKDQRKYIAYFQSFTNTYARDQEELARLEQLYSRVLQRDDIAILSLGTRPDCLDDNILEMLERVRKAAVNQSRSLPQIPSNSICIQSPKPIWIELGLQTMHDETAKTIHRGYDLSCFEDAYRRLTSHNFPVILHIILGLPGETEEDILETIRYVSNLQPHPAGIKLQLLHVLEGTQMGEAYKKHPFPVMEMDAYCDLVVKCLQFLPEDIVIHRMTGDGPRNLLIAPLWSTDKKRVLNTLNRKIEEAVHFLK